MKALSPAEAWISAHYHFDADTGCWVSSNAGAFTYSDGDEVENKLLQIVTAANDLTSTSTELRNCAIGWPLTYHLHPRRSNLLRPLEPVLKGRILEIGSGCGAITRYLGECGALVHAVEGSVRRAAITAARCRNLADVKVIVDTFPSLPDPTTGYDVVTLIGVLEYARIYFPTASGDPVVEMLSKARRFLRPGGVLILAIENQLGLKYFAGYKEDHLDQTMAGIEGRYSQSGVVTFGRRELAGHLRQAGFTEHEWWFPLPDYKLPVAILSENWATAPQADIGPAVSGALNTDVQYPGFSCFSLEQAAQVVCRNGLLADLANSFLVVASAQKRAAASDVLAYHFAVDRRSKFNKEVRFELQDGAVWVHTRRLMPEAETGEGPLSLQLASRAAFATGKHWQQELSRVLNQPGWHVGDLTAWAQVWFSALLDFAGVQQERSTLSASHTIGGHFLDAIPRNLIISPAGEPRFIDQEWRLAFPVEIGHMLYRGILVSLLYLIKDCAPPADRTPLNVVDLFYEVAKALGVALSDTDVQQYMELENDLRDWAFGSTLRIDFGDIRGRSLPVRLPLEYVPLLSEQVARLELQVRNLTEQCIERNRTAGQFTDAVDALSQSLLARDATIAHLQDRVRELDKDAMQREGLIAIAESALLKRRQQVDSMEHELAQRQHIIEAMLNGWSWKISSPVRLAGRAAKAIRALFAGVAGRGPTGSPVAQGTPGEVFTTSDRMPGRSPGDTLAYRHGFRYVHRGTDCVDAGKLDIKPIAFYVPEVNVPPAIDGWGGKQRIGWNEIGRAVPRYLGHYQPHLPDELGFYDLRTPGVLRRQIDVAKQYGIFGFSFYWQDRKSMLDGPLGTFLADPSLDLKFCLCWVNEDTLLRQDAHGDDRRSDMATIESVLPALSDPRYIRISEKPVLLVFRPKLLPDAATLARRWRAQAGQMGVPGLYLVAVRSDDRTDPGELGFDAAVEFPPYHVPVADVTSEHSVIDAGFTGHVYNYRDLVDACTRPPEPPFPNFKTVVPGWDNEPLKPGASKSFAGATPGLYAQWLQETCRVTMSRPPGERMVFINAWNSWAEGAHLEPDRRFGFAYLHATANVLRYYYRDPQTEKLVEEINAGFTPTSEVAIILHCHYEDLIAPIFDRYLSKLREADLFVTAPKDISKAAIEEIHRKFPNVSFLCQENRGRDVRPFLFALRRIRSLRYNIACKIHTKKTPNREGVEGEGWREQLMEPLLGAPDSVARAAQIFAQEPEVGLLVPNGSVLNLALHHVHIRNTFWLDHLFERIGRSDLIGKYTVDFPAGSMYWFRVSALAGLDELILERDDFEPELAQVDGTLAHAVERVVAAYAAKQGYRMKEIPTYQQSQGPELVGKPRGREGSAGKISPGPEQAANVELICDEPAAGQQVGSTFLVRGWTIVSSGIETLTVEVDEEQVAPVRFGLFRPDVAKARPGVLTAFRSGFECQVADVPPGNHRLRVRVRSRDGSVQELSRKFEVNGTPN
jgi:lipopolysaccharide biosynthesis protein/SAM-dependent methyltransferase